MNIEKLIKEGAALLDVRTPAEYMSGNVSGSKNIPLQEIPARVEEIKEMGSKIVVFCASGNRSGQACAFLSRQGIECYNGGSWMDINAQVRL